MPLSWGDASLFFFIIIICNEVESQQGRPFGFTSGCKSWIHDPSHHKVLIFLQLSVWSDSILCALALCWLSVESLT